MSIRKSSLVAAVVTAAIAGPTAVASACPAAGWFARQQSASDARHVARVHAQPVRHIAARVHS